MAELIWRGKTALPHNENPHDEQKQTVPLRQEIVNEKYYELETQTTGVPATDTWYNRLIQGDKSSVLPALLDSFRGSIKLIYIDPPFMTGRTFTNNARLASRLAYHDTWNNDLDTYLQWLYETLIGLYQLLAIDGSLYVHLDWHAAHYAKIILDEIFASDKQNRGAGFKNEIIWHYQSGGRAQKYFARKHDTILLYTKSKQYSFHGDRVGKPRGTQKRNHMRQETASNGHITWTIRSAGRTYTYDEDTPMSLADVWSDISHLHQKDPERTGYATQKPIALLERILLASSEEQDLVLDCFCGSGVTPVVAERLGRRWIACDKSSVAISLTCERLLRYERRLPFALQYVKEVE
jgi:site-specific DNA-methyltransferase (adenine-specific)/adenine-specific DNA-methyltransferase